MGVAMLITTGAVSLLTGWAAYRFAQSTGKYTEHQEAWIAVVAGLFVGPIIAYIITR